METVYRGSSENKVHREQFYTRSCVGQFGTGTRAIVIWNRSESALRLRKSSGAAHWKLIKARVIIVIKLQLKSSWEEREPYDRSIKFILQKFCHPQLMQPTVVALLLGRLYFRLRALS